MNFQAACFWAVDAWSNMTRLVPFIWLACLAGPAGRSVVPSVNFPPTAACS